MRIWGAVLPLLLAILWGACALAQETAPNSPLGAGPQPGSERSLTAGRPQPNAAPPTMLDRAWGWVLQQQQALQRELAAAVREIKAGDPVLATAILAGISFMYGVLHAAGPGHGKAVISSYVLANERTVRRGILLSFLAAFIQALSAIAIVGVMTILLSATSIQLRATEGWIESASWALVAAIGAWLLVGRVRTMLAAPEPPHAHAPQHAHANHDHAHHHHHQDHDHQHSADGSCCGHAHMPAAKDLEGDWSWKKAGAMALAVGIRPCTGAVLVLIFALSQGLLWAGVFATFAMALGTAITVSVLASLALGSRELATRLAGGDTRWASRVETAATLIGATVLLVLGSVFFVASLNSAAPF